LTNTALIRKTWWSSLTLRSHVVQHIELFFTVTHIHIFFFPLFYILDWRVITRGDSGGTRVYCLFTSSYHHIEWIRERKGQFTPHQCSLAVFIVIYIWWFFFSFDSDYEHRIRVLISVKIKLRLSPVFFSFHASIVK